jgi:uncharacterized membrane protein
MTPVHPTDQPLVLPADSDPVVAAATERIGGPVGARRRWGHEFWTPLRVLVVLAATAYTVGYLSKLPCHAENFAGDARYTRLCYSDIPYLYIGRGFADGWLPYIQTGEGQGPPLEYPVLTGFFMQIASWLTGTSGTAVERSMRFYDWNVLMLLVCLIVTVVATAMTVRRRPWDAAMVALAPGVILCSIINWDLLAVALTAVAMLAWSRSRPVWAGVLLGLAIAAKFYPLLLLGPLLLLCLRSARMRAFWVTAASAAGAWLVVNVPVYLANPEGWKEFYTFSRERGVDWGSPWYVLQVIGKGIPGEQNNIYTGGALVLLCLGIAALILFADRRPRFAQVAFLVVAAFCLTNKVYSPQYILWMIPLAAMARPRWRDFLIWQAGDVVYFVAIWYFLQQFGNDNKGLPEGWYAAAIMVHVIATAWFCGLVVRDILRPEHDPVRTDGRPEHLDDPGGGVLDGAPDRPGWGRGRDGGSGRELPDEPEPVGAHSAGP